MKCTVVLTKAEVVEAVTNFLMDKGFDEGMTITTMKAVGWNEPANTQIAEFSFEVSNEADASTRL